MMSMQCKYNAESKNNNNNIKNDDDKKPKRRKTKPTNKRIRIMIIEGREKSKG